MHWLECECGKGRVEWDGKREVVKCNGCGTEADIRVKDNVVYLGDRRHKMRLRLPPHSIVRITVEHEGKVSEVFMKEIAEDTFGGRKIECVGVEFMNFYRVYLKE